MGITYCLIITMTIIIITTIFSFKSAWLTGCITLEHSWPLPCLIAMWVHDIFHPGIGSLEQGACLIHLLSLYLLSSRILHVIAVVSLPFCNGWLSFGIQFHLFYELNIQKTKIMASGPITSWQIDGETKETVISFIFLGFKITADSDCSHKIKSTCSLEEKLWQIYDVLKSRENFANKCMCSQSYGFSSSHVWMWELDHKGLKAEKLILLSCGIGESSWTSLGLQGDQASQS